MPSSGARFSPITCAEDTPAPKGEGTGRVPAGSPIIPTTAGSCTAAAGQRLHPRDTC